MIGRAAAPERAAQQQVELLADALLADQLGQALRADARLGLPLLGRGVGGDQGLAHRVRPSSRIACFSSSATGGVG